MGLGSSLVLTYLSFELTQPLIEIGLIAHRQNLLFQRFMDLVLQLLGTSNVLLSQELHSQG